MFLAETVETVDKYREVPYNIFRAPCMFFEESLGKINAEDVEFFWNGSVYEFYRLKALITLEQMNSGLKKRDLYE